MKEAMEVVSLYDFTGEALKPWAEAGYECYAYDIQHPVEGKVCDGIHFVRADLFDTKSVERIVHRHRGRVHLVSAFPVCTDLASSGACWWKGKRDKDPEFQERAARRAMQCEEMAEAMGCGAWYVENPVGALSRLWRKPDHIFDPCDYGRYLSETDEHPLYPQFIPPRDTYRKKTCIWHGPGFIVPPKRPVEPTQVVCARKRTSGTCRYAPQAAALGGRSQRTKNIRSATPRGWAWAVFEANYFMKAKPLSV